MNFEPDHHTSVEQASELRGGATGGVDSEEEDDDSLDDDDEDFDDDGMDEEDFGEANFVDRLKQDWRKTPIITKTFFQVRMYSSGCHD